MSDDRPYEDWAYTWKGAVVMLTPFLAGLIVCLLWAALEGQLWCQ